jgi:2-oxoglutarate/2-oxoacid ferredoxin oxidoreductase subunit alpha
MSGINDFVIRFANVNGTGSASANSMFAKTIFRMGVPVTPKNIFPSNIQGLPTWYEVRISEKGYLGRKDEIDLMVATNPQSLKKDIASLKKGGYLLFDSSKTLHEEYIRGDIHYIGVPLMNICNEEFTDARQRQLFKNIVYVGALAELLNLDFEVIAQLFAEQFKGKEKLIAPNIKALNLGADFIKKNYPDPLPFSVEKRDLVKDKILLDGNTACGLGGIYAGVTVVSWYPITPSTSLVDAFADYAKELRVKEDGTNNFSIVQAEDELAAIGMVLGANWNGARSFTATSGPGLSLMNELLGLAYFAEIPAVLVDVQRAGPSTGMPTRTQQSDVMAAAYASHGDTKHILLFPSTPAECFDFMADAFDLAEHFQTPVIIMSDLDLGMNDHMSLPLRWDNNKKYNRGKVLDATDLEKLKNFGRYKDVDGDGVPYRTLPGTHDTYGTYFTRGTSHDEYAKYTEDSDTYIRVMERLHKKFQTAATIVPKPEVNDSSETPFGLLYYGTSNAAAEEAKDILAEEGHVLNSIKIKAFPFSKEVEDFIEKHEVVYVIEQNKDAQLRSLLMIELDINPKKLIKVLNYDGMPITANIIIEKIKPSLVTFNQKNLNLAI